MKSQYITPALTIFDGKGRLDLEQSRRLYEHLTNGGVSGMVVLGSIGEFFSLDMETSKRVIDVATQYASSDFRVLAGASRMDPAESIELANYALEKGADGVMIISPYYFPLNDDSVCAYYSEIAQSVSGPIYLYSFPDRTGYAISAHATLKLASRFSHIVGFKDTIPDMNHTCEIINLVGKELPYFEVFSGFDNNFAHNVMSGGAGCIGGLSNVVPELFADWISAIDRHDWDKIVQCQQLVDRLMAIYSIGSPFVPIIKKALVLRGVINSDACTHPLLSATDDQTKQLTTLFEQAGIASSL